MTCLKALPKRAASVILLGVLAAKGTALAADWPHWRGPTGDGHAPDKGINKDWNKRPPKELWSVKFNDDNHSGPCVARGRIYILDHTGGVAKTAQDIVLALDVQTGKEIWRYSYTNSSSTMHGGYSCSTPSYSSNRVYVLSIEGELRCFDAMGGTVVWKRHLRDEFKGSCYYGYNASPVIDGDHVIVCPGGAEGPLVVALNKTNGATVWQSESANETICSTPLVATLGGERQIIAFGYNNVKSIDAENGKTLWTSAMAREVPSPIEVNGNILITGCGFDYGCAMISPAGATLWTNQDMRPNIHTPVYEGGYIYGVKGSNHGPQILTCMDARTGKVMWRGPDIELGGMIAVDGVFISNLGSGSSEVLMFEANPKEYKELGRFTTPSIYVDYPAQCWTPPAIADGKLFIRRKWSLTCFDLM